VIVAGAGGASRPPLLAAGAGRAGRTYARPDVLCRLGVRGRAGRRGRAGATRVPTVGFGNGAATAPGLLGAGPPLSTGGFGIGVISASATAVSASVARTQSGMHRRTGAARMPHNHERRVGRR
jgi:hypothetical protein